MSVQPFSNDLFTNETEARPPRTSIMALAAGFVLALFLVLMQFPLLVSAGLWLLGLALFFIAYAFIARRRFQVSKWETAIAGQALGLIGLVILLFATILAV